MIKEVTAKALKRQKIRELRSLSEAEALQATDMLLSMPQDLVWRSSGRRDSRGLIERQRILYGSKKQP